MLWNKDHFLYLTGLGHDRAPMKAFQSEAAVDPHTGGAVVIESEGEADLSAINLRFWRRLASGDSLKQNLIEIETEPKGDNLELKSLHILGRPVPLADEASVHRVLEAVRRTNLELRDGHLPNLARIFTECRIPEAVNERLKLYGFDAERGLAFTTSTPSTTPLAAPLSFERGILEPLIGLSRHTLDPHQQIGPGRRFATAVNPQTGQVFMAESKVREEATRGGLYLDITPLTPGPQETTAVLRLAEIFWEKAQDGAAEITTFNLLGENMLLTDTQSQLRGLGIVNETLHAIRQKRYPNVHDYLVKFNARDLVKPFAPPPALKAGGRFLMLSAGGNASEEIVEGFGNETGACKVLIHEGLDEKGRNDRCVVLHDLMLFLPKPGSRWTGAAPDVVEYLKDCDHIFITHRHVDHYGGLTPYVAKGYLTGKNVYASPEALRAIKVQMQKDNVSRALWPNFVPLEGEGWHHIEKDGTRRFSVHYATDATPHTARCTPMRYIARCGPHILGSYINPGDMRFGWHLVEDKRTVRDLLGDVNMTEWLDRGYFQAGLRRLAEVDPTVPHATVNKPDTLADYDCLAIKNQGWSTIEPEAESNLTSLVSTCLKGKGVLLAMISTNDNRFETGLRVAARAHRHVTEVGAAVQSTATAFNKLGVNRHLVAPQEEANIQAYLDKLRLADVSRDIQRRRARRDAHGKEGKRALKAQRRFRGMLHELIEMRNPADRFARGLELEQDYEEEFGEKRRINVQRVGRTSKTAAKIVAGPPGERLVYITGTQGNYAEIDTTLNKLSEHRSLLDADPKNRHTALPISPENDVIIISQTSIPGNEKFQRAMIDRLVKARDFTVIEAVHRGFRIHNPKNLPVEQWLAGKNLTAEKDVDGSLTIIGAPIHASGHGSEEDVKQWLPLINAQINAPQHCDNESALRFCDHATAGGFRHPGRMFGNFEAIEIDNRKPDPAQSLGYKMPSLILVNIVRKFGKYFGGHIEAVRYIVDDGRQQLRQDGLMASAKGVYHQHFGAIEYEASRRDVPKAERPAPEPAEVVLVPEERPWRGMLFPKTPAMAPV